MLGGLSARRITGSADTLVVSSGALLSSGSEEVISWKEMRGRGPGRGGEDGTAAWPERGGLTGSAFSVLAVPLVVFKMRLKIGEGESEGENHEKDSGSGGAGWMTGSAFSVLAVPMSGVLR